MLAPCWVTELHTYITPDERVLHYPLAGTWVRADYLFASAGPESTYLLAASRSDYIGAEYLRICCPVSVIINLSLHAKNAACSACLSTITVHWSLYYLPLHW
jgi:hypothetical protein